MLDIGIGDHAGVHVVAPATVVRFAGRHAADNRQMMHLLRGQRHVLADLHVAGCGDRLERSTGGSTRFQIPNVDRGRTTAHPQQDR